MTTLYWILEYGKVAFAYIFIMFIWPEIMFRKYLKEKSITFQFIFCVTLMPVLNNSVVLLLGLCHILNIWVFRVLFWVPLAVTLLCQIKDTKQLKSQTLRFMKGTYGVKSLFNNFGHRTRTRARKVILLLKQITKGHLCECSLLGIVVLFGVIYFSYGAFQDYSYGFGDMYPHNDWVYGLVRGQIFSGDVYPEGMHCFLYAMHVLFGIRIYSTLLFTAGVHSAVYLLSAYILFREIFRWKYTPIVALSLFLTIDLLCIDEVYSMSRLQWTLPQEFALYAVLLIAATFIRYMRELPEESVVRKPVTEVKREPAAEAESEEEDNYVAPTERNYEVPKKKRDFTKLKKFTAELKDFCAARTASVRRFNEKYLYVTDNLILFMLALAVTIVTHFYTTIMAFILCLAFVPVVFMKLFKAKKLQSLVCAAILGLVIAFIPMLGALASGIPFQGSIGWAMGVMNGVYDSSGSITPVKDDTTDTLGDFEIDSSIIGLEGTVYSENATVLEHTSKKESKIVRLLKSFVGAFVVLFKSGYQGLYKTGRAVIIVLLSIASLLIYLMHAFYSKLFGGGNYWEEEESRCDHYLSLLLSTIFFMMVYCAPDLHLPGVIAGSRICSLMQLLIVGVCFIPLDTLFVVLEYILSEMVMSGLGVLCVALVYMITQLTGTFHGYLYFEYTRYNGAVMSTYNITRTLEPFTYTIVSPVDELYQQIQYGYHEEMVLFANRCLDLDYTLPTEYVFIFIEKHPLEYGQSHFFGGPKWLASEKYPALYSDYVSQCPEVTHMEISEEFGRSPYYIFPIWSKAYSNLHDRTVLESRMNIWCEQFSALYPGELNVYYEDDDFVCYYFRQNPACLYQLGFDLLDEIN